MPGSRWAALLGLLLAACPDEATVPTTGDGGTSGIVVLGDGAVVPVEDGGTYLGDGAVALPDGAVVPIPDGGIPTSDAGPVLATCDNSASGMAGCQCSDGIDQPCDGQPNGNGYVDEYDIFCTGPYDDDECSYATGIPGDNRSAAHGDRECFFDGDSGLGNDGDCALLVAPGCDCYGCCEFDVNGDDVKEVVRLGGTCDRFEVQGNPQPGQLGGTCLANGTCSGGLFCITDQNGGSFCGPCEPCAHFGGTTCNEQTGEGCCWNECDEAAGEVCFGDDPPPVTPYDAGTATGDGSTSTSDGGVAPRDASSSGSDASTGDPRCSGLPYCGTNGACPDGTFCYYACCYPLPG